MRRNYLPYLLLAPTIAVLMTLTIYPLIFSVYVSLHEWIMMFPATFARYVGLDNFAKMLGDALLLQSIANTFIFTTGAVTIEFVIGLMLALTLSSEVRGKRIFMPVLLIPMMVAPVVVAVMWRTFIFDPSFGLLNYFASLIGLPQLDWLGSSSTAMLGIIIMDAWEWTPFMTLVIFSGLISLPAEPFEAALVDGASAWQKFRNLTMPLLAPVVFVALLIRLMDAIKLFDLVYVATEGGPGFATETMSLYTFRWGFRYFYMGYASALSFVLLFLIIILSQLLIRYFRST